jgi:NAD(P)-dependent dehydrogenase (short-subunit alcohol dehydrogenase family)
MNILVNGGSRGIGKEIVKYLAGHAGNKILVTGRNAEALKSLAFKYLNVHVVVLDLSVSDDLSSKLINAVEEYFNNKLDILINVAGMLVAKEFMLTSGDEARLMMETNFFGPAATIRILKPCMSKGSHIVNIASMGSFQGSIKYKGLSYYSASKAALACLTECLATEFLEYGIIVNCLAIGAVQTEMFEEAFPGYKAPVSAGEMGEFIGDFALKGHKLFNGKILPVAVNNP